MASHCKVQDIKRKFESLIVERKPAIVNQTDQLRKHSYTENFATNCLVANSNLESQSDEESTKTTLSRQPSDPSKKLHRSHAFRCERTQKIRHSDSNNSENDFLARMCEKKLSKDRLKRLGDVLEDRMRRGNPDLIPQNNIVGEFRELIHNSVPDDKVPKHILDQYAKVNKKNVLKKDSTVDSGVGSETENLDDEKYGHIRKINLNLNESNSDDTIKLEKKNPHVVLTDTLKKALKQPLPVGPPPEKPPRTFISSPTHEKKSTKHMLNRLEEELLKREAKEKEKWPKELHYMCTEILTIQQRSLPNPKPVNCAMKYNTSTLPGHLNGLRNLTKKTDEHTYDIPYDESTEKKNEQINVATNFEKIRSNFENGFHKSKTVGNSNFRTADTKFKHVNKVGGGTPRQRQYDFKNGRKFGTEAKRYRRNERNDRLPEPGRTEPPKKCNKMDAERKILYRLMDEIYATVKVVNNMDDDRLGSSTDGSTTDESVKITRSLTEKRKNYVRGMSSRIAYLDPKNIKNVRSKTITCTYKDKDLENPYSTHRSWKSFRTSQKDLSQRTSEDSMDSRELSTDVRVEAGIDEKTGCLDIELCFEPREKGLFNVCMLVGFNFMNNEAYVKSVFPEQVIPPPHIESLIFPETLSSEDRDVWTPDGVSAQCYSLVLTDEKGERSYGYCRRVLPEGASACLPLAYCLIGKYRAPGFYYKVLQEIESLHGNSDLEMDSILQQLFETDFPEPGEEVVITYKDQTVNNVQIKNQIRMADMKRSKTMLELRRRIRDNSPAKMLGRDKAVRGREYSEMPAKRRILTKRETKILLPYFYDLENNNRSTDSSVIKHIKRPLEPRVDENNLSTLLDSLGAALSIKVFASLLLERKVFIIGDKLSEVSSCIEALQSVLYPFVWQQPLISSVPAAIQQDMLDAPLPILAGVLRRGTHRGLDLTGVQFEGMLIDLSSTNNKVLFCEGDESTIIPNHSYKSLKASLQMWLNKQRDKHEDVQSRNLLISEAFLRFFVEILGDFSKCFSQGELKEGGFGKAGTVFDKDTFIKSALTKQNQHFLEWFTETAMFNHFIQNMAVLHSAGQSEASAQSETAAAGQSQRLDLVDTPLPNFYEVFNDRIRSGNRTNVQTKKSLVFLKNKMKDMLVKFQK